nr:retrovirus-related Pol polyprotein from transposon TNT 1-94 [Tanacetum cinerariifolium]
MAAGQRKPKVQWTKNERKAANLYSRLKSPIMYVLLDDQMNSIINYLSLTAKSTWDDLILDHKGPSDVKESRVTDLKLCYNTFKFKKGETPTQTFTRYKALMNELVNDGIKLSKLEINTDFINVLPKKWLAFCQSLRNTNHVKESELASVFAKYNKVKAKLALLGSSASASKSFSGKNKGLIAKTYEWDKEEVSSDEETKVKALMALADEERVFVGKESARNGEWVKISIQKYNSNMSITTSNKPRLSEAENSTMPNHETDKVFLDESERNKTDLSVAISDSSLTDYDSTNKSSVCSTSLPPLEKLAGAEPVSGPKTIKLILKSN